MEEVKNKSSKHVFKTSKNILNLVTHSVYQDSEIFLRELISNASDACSKLKYISLTDSNALEDSENHNFAIHVSYDIAGKTISISDNGIGMDKDELLNNLGTIARSGTNSFQDAENMKKSESELIGQFGIGFYSSFLVADSVTVTTRKPHSEETLVWESEGKENFSIKKIDEKIPHGTTVLLHLKKDHEYLLDRFKLEHIITSYSNYLPFPVYLTGVSDDTSETAPKLPKNEKINTSVALWTKNKNDVTPKEHQEFFNSVAHIGGSPWMVIHNKNEGLVEYTNLLYIPSIVPFDLFNVESKSSVQLYVKKVFITEDKIDLLPRYLRFIKGIIDCSDLPLNISRETLQKNQIIKKIQTSLVKKIISELENVATNENDKYINEFWKNFGSVLKEGLCEALPTDERERLLGICRFYSAKEDKLISLDDYIKNSLENQKSIYYFNSENLNTAKSNPILDSFLSRGLDVLLFIDPVDNFFVNIVQQYQNVDLKSITKSDINLEDFPLTDEESSESEDTTVEESSVDNLITYMKEFLKDYVEDVIKSKKLATTPACIATKEGAMDIKMEQFMFNQNRLATKSKKIFEINATHPLIRALSKHSSDYSQIDDQVLLLFMQACIVEGEEVSDMSKFSKIVTKLLTKSVDL